MSTLFVEVVKIADVSPHPNADRLEIVKILGTACVTQKGTFYTGQHVAYFPPDILIPESVSEMLGVQKYLKHSQYDGVKIQCRVAGCKLRGVPSFGFVVPLEAAHNAAIVGLEERSTYAIGDDLNHWFDARKYEPPVRLDRHGFPMGDRAPDHPLFHKYTSIEHYWKYHDTIPEGTPVRITEKIHGTNSRVGLIKTAAGEMEFMAGSHKVQRKRPFHLPEVRMFETPEGPLLKMFPAKSCVYWKPLENESMVNMLFYLAKGGKSVIVFGEIFGQGVQDMDYGTSDGYQVFDICVDGIYLDWDDVEDTCCLFKIPTVPLLYRGPFTPDLVEKFTYGPTALASAEQIKSTFKDREGCVITPLKEMVNRQGNRVILKSVSADYLDRKGAEDNE